MTLTTRLSLFFMTTLGLVLVGFAVTLYVIAFVYLHRQINERLDAVLNTLVASVDVAPEGLEWEPTERHLNLGPASVVDQVAWLVHDDKGRLVDRSGANIARPVVDEVEESLPKAEHSSATLAWQRQNVQYRQRRLQTFEVSKTLEVSAPPQENGKRYPVLVITTAIPLQSVETTLQQLALALGALSVAIWTLAVFVGRAVSRRALAPLIRMARSAREIDAHNLEQRLPRVSSADELADLSSAFNSLLERVQDSFERQKRFTSDASHQLRTPLAAMLGQVEVALRRDRPPEEYQRVLDTVRKRAHYLQRIVESLLFLARADREAGVPALEDIDLATWLAAYVRDHEPQAGSHKLVFKVLGHAPCVIQAQRALLEELLNILVDNGCKYSEDGKPITIRLIREEKSVSIHIEDQGCGIEPAEFPHLFTPFFRSNRSRHDGVEGVGLGLSIAKRLAQAFGGKVSATSASGKGSCFTLTLATATAP